MRIVYILTSLGVGGAERQVLALGERMARRGHRVALLVLRPRLPEEWPTRLYTIHLDIFKNPASVLAGIASGCRFLRDFRPEIVHGHGFHGNLMARAWRLLAASPKPISTIHNVYEGGWLRMFAYRLTDPLSAMTTAVSEAAAERFTRMKAVPKRKCVVLSNGIDVNEFAPDAERRARLRSEMGVDNEFVWLAAGRIVPAKDYPNLLRAFAHLRSQNANGLPGSGDSGLEVQLVGSQRGCPRSLCWDLGRSQLWIAGEATGSGEAAAVRSLAANLSLQDCIEFLGLRRDLPALLDAADGFVLGSAWEGMPLAVGEAMAMEKPVVATDVGGTRELLGETGVVVPAKDSTALAEAMLSVMLMTPLQRAEMGAHARTRIRAQFSLDAKADEWEALYAPVLRGRSQGVVDRQHK